MRIVVFGSYNGTSVGDTAILLGLLRAIGIAIPAAKVTVLTTGPVDLSRDTALTGQPGTPETIRANAWDFQEAPVLRSLLWRVNRLVRFSKWLGPINVGRCRAVLDNQDVLIIGGGNLLMDLFEDNVAILETVCNAARAAGVPYVFLGVGAGPVASADARLRLGACLAGARVVFVRDSRSRSFCREALGRDDTRQAPDLAFALHDATGNASERDGLALNLASYGDKRWPWRDETRYREYIAGFVRLTHAAAQRYRPSRIDIVSTNTFVDQRATNEINTALTQGDWAMTCPVKIAACADVTGVLDAFSHAELAITTRLHAGILASVSGCSVLPVAYDQKVSAVLREEGVARSSVSIEELADPAWSPDGLFPLETLAPTVPPRDIVERVVTSVKEALIHQ